jgi:methylmalonyl-CoA epimerase
MTDQPDLNGEGLPGHLITRIDHVAIVVRSIEQALGFYRDLLGLQPSAIKALPSEGVRIAFLPSGGPQGSEIELVEPTDPSTGVAQFLEKRGEGLHHMCLETPDIDAALAYLSAGGARVLDATPRQAAEGRAIFVHPKSANGVLLELVQRAEAAE